MVSPGSQRTIRNGGRVAEAGLPPGTTRSGGGLGGGRFAIPLVYLDSSRKGA